MHQPANDVLLPVGSDVLEDLSRERGLLWDGEHDGPYRAMLPCGDDVLLPTKLRVYVVLRVEHDLHL